MGSTSRALASRLGLAIALPLGAGLVAVACGYDSFTADIALKYCEEDLDCIDLAGTKCSAGQFCVCVNAGEDFCEGACRPELDCAYVRLDAGVDGTGSSSGTTGTGGTGGTGSASSSSSVGGVGGGGGVGGSVPECTSPTECPRPAEPRCGEAVCVDGACGIAPIFGPIASQVLGDCQTLVCDAAGAVVGVEDPSDFYHDGNRCTYDWCEGGVPVSEPFPNGFACPGGGSGYCYEGECVECIADTPITHCPGLACDFIYCVPMHCVNMTFEPDAGETGFDCGGPCAPCIAGQSCATSFDCADGVCVMGKCALPLCGDGVANDGETGPDCGAASCGQKCPVGAGCLTAADCKTGVCWAGECSEASCFDATENGGESGVDCGGGDCPPCL